MKIIAVFYDFSKPSEHAARYALHLAKKLKTNILLFDISFATLQKKQKIQAKLAGSANGDTVPLRSELLEFGKNIDTEQILSNSPGAYLPSINCDTTCGDLAQIMASVLSNSEIIMITTSPFNKESLAEFLISNTCKLMLDWSTIPVLIVPECTLIRNIEKMVFCTSLSSRDADYINALAHLLKPFGPELMIVHLNGYDADRSRENYERILLQNIIERVNYGRCYYRNVPFDGKKRGWIWLKAHKTCDLLVIVQQPQQLLKAFFEREQNTQMTHHLTIPALIFPETY